jgi:hypothetical protein
MQVEDSYEGAMARLQRLERAGIVVPPLATAVEDESFTRTRDLEELATLACEENERLQQQLYEARGHIVGLERELVSARDQIGSLQRLLAMLEESAAQPAPPPAAVPMPAPVATRAWPPVFATQPVAPAPAPLAPEPAATQAPFELDDSSLDPSLALGTKSGGAIRYLVLVALVGAVATGALTLRPWEHGAGAAVVAASLAPIAPPPAPAPVVAVAPSVTIPKAEPTIPKVEPTIPKVEAARPQREPAKKHHLVKHTRHANQKSRVAKKSSGKRDFSPTDDPLGGLNL